MHRLDKAMKDTTKAERKESIDRMEVALSVYQKQEKRLRQQAQDAKVLAEALALDYTVALGAYLPTPEAQQKLQLLTKAYNNALYAEQKSEEAASGFVRLQRVTTDSIASIKAVHLTVGLDHYEDRVFAVNRASHYTNGETTYGLHETMLKADDAYNKAVALAAKGRA